MPRWFEDFIVLISLEKLDLHYLVHKWIGKRVSVSLKHSTLVPSDLGPG